MSSCDFDVAHFFVLSLPSTESRTEFGLNLSNTWLGRAKDAATLRKTGIRPRAIVQLKPTRLPQHPQVANRISSEPMLSARLNFGYCQFCQKSTSLIFWVNCPGWEEQS